MTAISDKPGDALKKDFHLDPSLQSLNSFDQEKVFDRCLQAYQKSVVEFDKAAAKVAFENERANAFAKVLCERVVTVIEAYSEILEDERAALPKNPLHTREMMREIRLAGILGNDSVSSGSVGYNVLSIRKVLKEGNLRERMTVIYKGFFPFMLRLLDTPGMIDKLNAKLAQVPLEKRFLIDKTLYLYEQERGIGFTDEVIKGKPQKMVVQPAFISQIWKENSREYFPKRSAREGPIGPKVKEIPELSLREARVGTRFAYSSLDAIPKDKRLTWMSGKDTFVLLPSCRFAKEARSLGLPLLTGPSGTTDAYLHLSKYLGLGNHLDDCALACAAWMIPVGDHSLHELRIVGNVYGITYSGKPEDFAHYHSPSVQGKIDAILAEKGFQNPSYYFSPEYQKIIAKELT